MLQPLLPSLSWGNPAVSRDSTEFALGEQTDRQTQRQSDVLSDIQATNLSGSQCAVSTTILSSDQFDGQSPAQSGGQSREFWTDLLTGLRGGLGPKLICHLTGRVELTGAVVENWLNKLLNLLCEEWQLQPGEEMRLHVREHWRSVLWALAAELSQVTVLEADVTVGAHPETNAFEDYLVTDDPVLASVFLAEAPSAPNLNQLCPSPPQIAPGITGEANETATVNSAPGAGIFRRACLIDPHPFAWRYRGDLPTAVEDANALVLGQPDVLLNESGLVASVQGGAGRAQIVLENGEPVTDLQSDVVAIALEDLAESQDKPLPATNNARLARICGELWARGATVVLINSYEDQGENLLIQERVTKIWH